MGHPWSSVAIMGHLPNKVDTYPCHQGRIRVIKGTHMQSRAYPCHQGHSHAIKGTQARSHLPEPDHVDGAIKGTQARSHLPEPDHVDGAVAVLTHLMRDAIMGHQWFISGHQWSSVVISGHQ